MIPTTKKALPVLFTVLVLSIAVFFTFQHKNTKTKLAGLNIETFQTDTGGWGYNIVTGEKILIKQDIIPAIESNIPFQSEKDAKKTASLVIKKMKSKKFPTITVEELNELNVATKKKIN